MAEPKVFFVHLRRPGRDDRRDDPFYADRNRKKTYRRLTQGLRASAGFPLSVSPQAEAQIRCGQSRRRK